MEFIKKLLNISSNEICKNFRYEIDPEIDIVLNQKNGFFTFENTLHFFSDKEIEEINVLIKNKTNYNKECLFFAEDIFGNLFCKNKGIFYLMDVETGELEFISNNINEWAKKNLEDYDYLTGYSLAHEWQIKNRILYKNERLIPKKFFIFGGSYSIDNLYPMDRIKALLLRENIYKNLTNIKDGEKIIIESK